MPEYGIPAKLIAVYLLVFLRLLGMLWAALLFTSVNAPKSFTYLFTLMLTLAIVPAANLEVPLALFNSLLSLGMMGLREFIIGMAIGFFSLLPIYALHIAGQQMGVEMGLHMAMQMDPLSQSQTSLIGQLNLYLGLWFFFHWNGHLMLFQAVIESLKLVPLASFRIYPSADMAIGQWMHEMFKLAIRMVIPFYCALMLATVGLGFLARTVPQMNVLVLGMPLKIGLGMIVLLAVMPLLADVLFENMERFIEIALEKAALFSPRLYPTP